MLSSQENDPAGTPPTKSHKQMTRFDILFIVGLTVSLIIFNLTKMSEKAAPFIFLPLFLCYLCGRAVGFRIARNQETEITEK